VLETLAFQFVWLAIICGLVLAGIHAYLGFHIVSRGVIFVDLSLAQMAALGAAFATLVGVEEGSVWRYVVSVTFTFIGAGIVSLARVRNERVPQEAFIGILYGAGAAMTILLLAHRPGGMEELQHLLAGSILTVTPAELIKIAVTYALIGGVHYAFREKFFLITENRQAAVERGWRTRAWDFVFYSTFAIVVTSSVAVAGVLLVFSLLVIPPVTALLFTRKPGARLLFGWIIAFLGSTAGVLAAVALDLPAGPSIVACLVVLLLMMAGLSALPGEGRVT
jgi:zinc/manganese transport system permease protein